MMGTKSVRGLMNSICRFIHLAACRNIKPNPVQKDFTNMVSTLKLLKPVLDEVVNSKIPSDTQFVTEIEELDFVVNEARELMERWSPKMSKIFSVLQTAPLMAKIKNSSLVICHKLSKLQKSTASLPNSTCVQHCMQDLRCIDHEDKISELIEEVLRDRLDNLVPRPAQLLRLVESLCLTSSQRLLSESIALEKERYKAELHKNEEQMVHIDQIMDLVSQIRQCLVKLKEINSIPIPSHFCCPLSLKVMVDPVIVASGQTYERSFIQKWLDQGLRICPISRQPLSHIDLIPNYTVKALITSWQEDQNIKHSSIEFNISSLLVSQGLANDLDPVDDLQDIFHSEVISHSSLDVANNFERQKVEMSPGNARADTNLLSNQRQAVFSKLTLHWEPHDGEANTYSRSESPSSEISSLDDVMPRESSKCECLHEMSGEILSDPVVSPSNKNYCFSSRSSVAQFHSSNPRVLAESNKPLQPQSDYSLSDSANNDSTTSFHAQELVKDLNSQSEDVQTSAAAKVRNLAKYNMVNREILAKAGVITPLISLLYSPVNATQVHAVTALLNLSINDSNKSMIAEAGILEPLIHVLISGSSEARENSAATLFSLSVLEQYKSKIGRSGAIKALVELLHSGTLRGKKDAATALFNLSICHENRALIVKAGAVKHLVDLMQTAKEMADKALAIIANLATIPEGRACITREGGIPLLVEFVETGSQRGKENAACTLLQLCMNSQKLCTLVLQEGVVPPLIALSQSGTPRAKEKAQQLLCHFRSQREGSAGKS